MKAHEKICTICELHNRLQGRMAYRLGSYAKLEQIASVISIVMNKLTAVGELVVVCLINENEPCGNKGCTNTPQERTAKTNRLQQLLNHQDALTVQRDALIAKQACKINMLHMLVTVLQKNGGA